MRKLAVLIGVLVGSLGAGGAHAFVRYTTDQGVPFYWQTSCVGITIYPSGFTEMSTDEVAKAVSAAAHTWSPDDVTCPDSVSHPFLEIVPSLSPTGTATAKYDARNVLIFQNDTWEHAGDALALTTVLAKGDGRIVDADIEVNGTPGLQWENIDPGADVSSGHGIDVQDLQNALTHEFGHFIGLDHTCYTPDTVSGTTTKPRPNDNLGQPVPDCSSASDAIRATVMFPSTAIGETSKRVLSPDDVNAVCTIYPQNQDPQDCAMDSLNDGLTCATGAVASKPRAPLLALAVFGLGAIGAGRLRRRRR